MKPVAFLLTLAGLLSVSEAKAQHPFHRGASHRGVATSTMSYPATSHAAPANPPMGYAGSGYNNFPYYGGSYGHPFARWTWPNMSGAYGQGLARYYDPPVK